MHARPASRRVADAEVRCGARVEAPLPEERPCGAGFGRRQLRPEELGGGRVGGVETSPSGRVRGRSAVLVMQRVADAPGESLDRLGERHVVHLGEEGVDVAGLAAAEAVIEARLRPDVEARAALVVERAQALHGADAGVLERDTLADDVRDVRAGLDLFDVGLPDPARHQSSSDATARAATGRRRPGRPDSDGGRVDLADQPRVPGDGVLVGETRDLVDDRTPSRSIRLGSREILRVHGIQGFRSFPQRRGETREHPALLLVEGLAAFDRDHGGADDALEHCHLGLDHARNHGASGVTGLS